MFKLNELIGFGARGGLVFNIIITSNQTNWSLSDEVTNNHNWNGVTPFQAFVTINTGVILSATATGVWGYRADSTTNPTPPAGTKVFLVNLGKIIGKGGNGGIGGTAITSCTTCSNGTNGGAAGHAMKLAGVEHEITNGSGNIWGGGGGGGGGGGDHDENDTGDNSTSEGAGGGGGGGGTGTGNGGAGGANPTACDQSAGGGAGISGTNNGGGSGGSGASTGGARAGNGGVGGGPGASGAGGSNGFSTPFCSGGNPGVGGAAINRNGAVLTWKGGDTSPNRQGAITG